MDTQLACQRCGASLLDGASFCHACGAPQSAGGSSVPATTGFNPAMAQLMLQNQQQMNALHAQFQQTVGALTLQVRSLQLGHLSPVIPTLAASNRFFSPIPGSQITELELTRTVNITEGISQESLSVHAKPLDLPAPRVEPELGAWEHIKEGVKKISRGDNLRR